MKRTGHVWALAVAVSTATSCASIDRLSRYPEPPQVYGGIRNWSIRWGEKLIWSRVYPSDLNSFLFLACLPLSDFVGCVALDTVALPLTAWVEEESGDDDALRDLRTPTRHRPAVRQPSDGVRAALTIPKPVLLKKPESDTESARDELGDLRDEVLRQSREGPKEYHR